MTVSDAIKELQNCTQAYLYEAIERKSGDWIDGADFDTEYITLTLESILSDKWDVVRKGASA